MNTTISSNGPSPLRPTKNEQSTSVSQEQSGSASASPSRATATDSVQLTDSARALQQASATDQAGQVDTAKVERIRQSLADGSYRVDAGAIADRLTSLESQISGS